MKGDKLSRNARYGILAAVIAGTFSIMPMAQAMPTGANSSAAKITTTGSVMDISSSVENNIITWQSFSIGKNEQVNFDDNNYLNYVTGTIRSDILGTLTGGGNIYLVNPNGIVVGDGAQINVGSLHLSTAELSGANLNDFGNAVTALSGVVTPKGDVINKGNLHANAVNVQGENITFQNVTEVEAPVVTLNAIANGTVTPARASGEIHLGYKDADGDYSTVDEPSLTGWTLNGAVSKYMLVETPADLQAMNTNLSGNYMLANDIDMSVVDNFTPIGVSNSNYFTGRFDGGNHIISNLTIEYNEYGKVGFFGGVSGILENFGLDNSLVKTTYSVNDTGGVAGVLQETGVIRNVYDIGDVIGSNAGSTVPTGGIVGRLAGGTVSNVFHRGSVSGIIAGGIVGYFTGNNPIVENAYNEGSVTGTNVAGGVVGDLFDSGQVNNVYNAGSITSTNGTNAGGVLGEKFPYGAPNPATVFHEAYYATTDSEGNNINQGAGTNSYGSAKTLEELTNAGSYSDSWSMDTDGSDSHSTWRIYPGQTTPFLTAFMTPMELSGTEAYELSSVYTGEEILVGKGTSGDVTVRNVGEYTINDLSSLYSNQQGYNIHVADGTTASLKYIVTPAALTITAAAANKVYDGTKTVAATESSYSVSGLLGSDTYSNPIIAFDSKNIGTGKPITISGGNLVDGNNGKNYEVTYIGSSGIITPKELSLAGSVINTTKMYDGTTAVDTQAKLSITGMVSGDDVSLNTGNIEVEYPDKSVGNYDLTYNSSGAVSLVGTDAINYTITGELNAVAGTGTILPKELTVTFADISKVYDGTTAANPGSVQVSGLVGEEKVGLASTFTAQYDGKNVGSHVVYYSGLSLAGNDAENYQLVESTVTGKGMITPRTISAVFEDIQKNYDGTPAASSGDVQLINVVSKDNVQLATGFTTEYDGKNVGSHRVYYRGLALAGVDAGNYMLTEETFVGNGTIAAAPITFKANDFVKVYDGTTNAPGASYSLYEGTLFAGDQAGKGVFSFEDNSVGIGKILKLGEIAIMDGNNGKNYQINYLPSTNSVIQSASPLHEWRDKIPLLRGALGDLDNAVHPNVAYNNWLRGDTALPRQTIWEIYLLRPRPMMYGGGYYLGNPQRSFLIEGGNTPMTMQNKEMLVK